MSILPGNEPLVGNRPGWLLSFHRERGAAVEEEPTLVVSSADYHADIRASLPGDLSGGSYTFVVERMTDQDYGKIVQSRPDAATVVYLHLFWHDIVGSYLPDLAGLSDVVGVRARHDAAVAELAVTRVSRRLGSRSYEAVVEARERVFDRLAKHQVTQPVWAIGPLATAVKLLDGIGVAVRCHVDGAEQPRKLVLDRAGPAREPLGDQVGEPMLQALRNLATRMEQSGAVGHGRSPYLIRSGELHVGMRRAPLDGRPKGLTAAGGLVEARAEPLLTAGSGTPSRRQFTLVLKGRPDLRPGDVVEFEPPPAEGPAVTLPSVPLPAPVAAVGDLLEEVSSKPVSVRLYVSGVEHALGRTTGFSTNVSGVELEASRLDTPSPTAPAPPSPAPVHPSAERRVAQAVEARIQAMVQSRRLSDVGEVRGFTAAAGGAEGPPSQTETVWRGLTPPDGEPGQAARLPVERARPGALAAVPYVSPFAWGRCGLVLPRYPGMRVLLTHRSGAPDDPVEVGGLWEAGRGPDAQPGDWWLSTPVGVPQQQRAVAADDGAPAEHTGEVANDLIDADGVRIIEVGQLVVRVGADSNRTAGRRPDRGQAKPGTVTIEHADGKARIVVKQDGSIELKGSTLVLDAGAEGQINLKAKNVNVSCTTMKIT